MTLRYYARGRDLHLLLRCARFRPDCLNGFNNIHTFDDFPKHNVPPIEPRCDDGCDEELSTHTTLIQCFVHIISRIPSHTCEPLLFAPALAIESSPGLSCFSLKFSSTKRTGKPPKSKVFCLATTRVTHRQNVLHR